MSFEVHTTEDGSISIRDPETGELHHNRAGAYAEALVNYIEPVLKSGYLEGLFDAEASKTEGRELATLEVLDVCFGLGYNTLVLLSELGRAPVCQFKSVNVTAFEKDQRVLAFVAQALQFPAFEKLLEAVREPEKLSQFGDIFITLANGCTAKIRLVQGDIRELVPDLAGSGSADLDVIFHDPFSPKRVPELWTIDLFQCYRSLLDKHKGMVLTYSSGSAVRGGLIDAGFHVWRSTALGGKSGGTVATVNATLPENPFVLKLSDDEKKKLRSASGVPFRDPTFHAERNIIKTQRLSEQFDYRLKK